MSVVYNDRVHIWNINTTFYNVCANKHIIFFINKIHDMLFQFMTFHLPMCYTNAQIGTKSLNNVCHFGKTLYPVINKKYLSSPFGFIIDGIADQVFIINVNFSLDWLAIRWWCVNDAKVPCTHQ